MKITMSRHGGFGAGLRMNRPAAQLDTSALPDVDVAALERLISAAQSAGPPEPAMTRDGMSYTITVERDGNPAILKGSDGAMSSAFAELLSWLAPRMPE
jgi:hypothetical protein